jgi:hypothetical protein
MNARFTSAFVAAVVLHSAAIGLALLFFTAPGLALGGYEEVRPLFFPRQAGAFHLVVAAAYAIEYLRYRGLLVMVTAKGIAVAFLVGILATGAQPWVVPVSAAGDAAMGFVALWLQRGLRARAPR